MWIYLPFYAPLQRFPACVPSFRGIRLTHIGQILNTKGMSPNCTFAYLAKYLMLERIMVAIYERALPKFPLRRQLRGSYLNLRSNNTLAHKKCLEIVMCTRSRFSDIANLRIPDLHADACKSDRAKYRNEPGPKKPSALVHCHPPTIS